MDNIGILNLTHVHALKDSNGTVIHALQSQSAQGEEYLILNQTYVFAKTVLIGMDITAFHVQVDKFGMLKRTHADAKEDIIGMDTIASFAQMDKFGLLK
jgi:hypothetical protein